MEKKLSLSSVLDQFRGAQEKQAGDTESVTNEPAIKEPVTKEPITKEAAEPVTEPVTKEASNVKETVDADVLKGIAKEAAENESLTLQKEATEFGKIFAKSVLEELELNNVIKQASDAAYTATVEVLEQIGMQDKLAAITKEAHDNTLVHLAETQSFNITRQTLQKDAAEKFASELPAILMSTTQEAYDLTVGALQNA